MGLWLFVAEWKMKSLVVAVGYIIVFIAVLLCYNDYEEYSSHSEYSILKTYYDDYLRDCIKLEVSSANSTEESPFYNISYNFIDIKKHEFKKNLKKEFKYKPFCNKSNSDSKEQAKNAPCFLSHLHFATSDPNADRGCKNKFIML